MSAQLVHVSSPEPWTQWVTQVVNGVFPLRRCLGHSIHGAVFLTEHPERNLPDAAIKLVRADGPQAKALLARWSAAATLSHPHLLRLFEVGQWHANGQDFVFVVMEHAEQTLAEVLRRRPLAPEEAQELFPPVLDALGFLHRNRLAHGQLKPSNLLAVNDQLKLASDSARPAGHSATGIIRAAAYSPPELKEGGISAAGDVWAFGMTLVEALTQRAEANPLPASFPAPFLDTVRRCLIVNPEDRPTVADLEARSKSAPPAQSDPSPSSAKKAKPESTAPHKLPNRNLALLAVGATFLIPLAISVAWRFSESSQVELPPPVVAAPAPAPAPEIVAPVEPEPELASAAPPAAEQVVMEDPTVLQEVLPNVPQPALDRIRGRIFVTIRVLVERDGSVMGTLVEDPGPNQSFASLADDAAREWVFAPAEKQNSRVWLVRFEFTRNGVTARPIAQ